MENEDHLPPNFNDEKMVGFKLRMDSSLILAKLPIHPKKIVYREYMYSILLLLSRHGL